MNNTVQINNWTESDRKVLFEPLTRNLSRKKKSIHINESLIDRFEKIHPKKNNNTHSGISLSDAVNKGLLLYLKLYEDEEEHKHQGGKPPGAPPSDRGDSGGG